MSPLGRLLVRDDTLDSATSGASSSIHLNPIYVAGFAAAGAIVLGLVLWLSIRFLRNRSRKRRDDTRGGAFLSVRGLVKEEEEGWPLPDTLQAIKCKNPFSRAQITPSIILPEKAITHPQTATREDIIDYHRASGAFPRPFAPVMGGPFALALAASPRSSLAPPSPNSGHTSFLSMSSVSRYSVMSTVGSLGAGGARKVHQLFTPVLPDELLLAKVGERLAVMQSFDDGWCVVGRQTGAAAKKSPFGAKHDVAEGVELGVVPAWCFIKPVKGLRAERPVRSSSLGITVELERPGFSSREEVASWSNF